MVFPKIVFLKCQISEDSDLLQACLKGDYSKLKESLLDTFDINLNTMKQTHFYSDKLHFDSLTIITIDLNERFSANTLKGDVIKDLKDFLSDQ